MSVLLNAVTEHAFSVCTNEILSPVVDSHEILLEQSQSPSNKLYLKKKKNSKTTRRYARGKTDEAEQIADVYD